MESLALSLRAAYPSLSTPCAADAVGTGTVTARRGYGAVLRVVGRGLPLDGVPAGEYTLRLVLSDGRSMVTGRADVTPSP